MRTKTSFIAAMFAAALFLWPATPKAQSPSPSSVTLDGMILDLPAPETGWERKILSDGVVLQKVFPVDANVERTKKGAALIQINKPANARNAFAAEFQTFIDGFTQMEKEKPLTTDKGLTINGHPIVMHLYCCRGPNNLYMQMRSVGIDSAKRHHFLRLVTFALNRADEKETEAVFQSIVRSVRPSATDRAFAMVPSASTDALKGVYKTLKTGIRPNVFGGTDFFSENRLMVFNGQGLYSTEIPVGTPDIATHCRTKPNDCGLYSLKGGGFLSNGMIETLATKNNYGMVDRSVEPITISSGEIKIGETIHTKVPPQPTGTRLNGSWRALSASSGQTAFTSGGFASEKTLILSKDGRYERTSFTSVSSSVESGGLRTSAAGGNRRPHEKGRYAIEGHAIRLTSDDGKVTDLSFFMPDIGSDKLLIIDGSNYLK